MKLNSADKAVSCRLFFLKNGGRNANRWLATVDCRFSLFCFVIWICKIEVFFFNIDLPQQQNPVASKNVKN
jgi:hypothetical protein